VPDCLLKKESVFRLTSIVIKSLKRDFEIITELIITTDFKTNNQKCYPMDYTQSCVTILKASPTLTLTNCKHNPLRQSQPHYRHGANECQKLVFLILLVLLTVSFSNFLQFLHVNLGTVYLYSSQNRLIAIHLIHS
jgi:hypothetical protein